MRNKIVTACLFVCLLGCNRQAFVEHKVTLEKKADNCLSIAPAFGLTSNFGGERYTFEKCLPADYDKSLIVSERKGDTVIVRFPLPSGKYQPALFEVTLDIDSYPKYSTIKVDDDNFTIGATEIP